MAVPAPSEPKGFYRVSNLVEVTLRDLGSIGRVLKAATDAGANSAWGINFELEDDRALTSQARARAVERAKQAAEELAQLGGVKLGPLLSISETNQEGYSGGGGGMMMRAAAADASLPIQHGEITKTYIVQIVYDTKRGEPGLK